MIIFGIACSLILCHELDAIWKKEWTLLYVLRSLPDSVARYWFVALHAPLFFLIFWSFLHPNGAMVQLLFSGFFVVHAFIHLRLRILGKCPFTSLISRLYIDGSAIFGAIHLLKAFL